MRLLTSLYSIVVGCIIVVAQHMHHHIHDVTTAIDKQWRSTGRHKSSEFGHQGEFPRNHYMFESVHDGDHDGVVRIFIGLSCKL